MKKQEIAPIISNGKSSLDISALQQKWKEIILGMNKIKKVRFEKEEDMNKIRDISANDVEEKKEICYMNACLAQTLFLIKKLKNIHNAENIFL
jgi:hypothetical protein